MARINTAIRLGSAVETVEELLNPEAQLPIVYQSAANLYQAELFNLQLQGGRVRLSLILQLCAHIIAKTLLRLIAFLSFFFFLIKGRVFFSDNLLFVIDHFVSNSLD